MKRLILLAAACVLLAQGQAQAQEIEPLTMKIMLQWTVAGAFAGLAAERTSTTCS